MALVVGGVCRFTYDMTYGDRDCHNVVDMHIFDRSVATSRHDAITDQAQILADQWSADLAEHFPPALTLNAVSWVDLDTETGEIGSLDVGESGTDNTVCFPGNVAVLVTKNVTSERGSRKGRFFVMGYPEASTDSAEVNVLTDSARDAFQDDWDDWLGNVNQDGAIDPPSYKSNLVVVHITDRDVDGHPSAGVYHTVSGLTVESRLSTQRRRLRGRSS